MQFPTFHICDFITRHIFISIINTSQFSITVEPNLKKGKHKGKHKKVKIIQITYIYYHTFNGDITPCTNME